MLEYWNPQTLVVTVSVHVPDDPEILPLGMYPKDILKRV